MAETEPSQAVRQKEDAHIEAAHRGWAVFLERPVTAELFESGALDAVFDEYDPEIVWDVTAMGLPDLAATQGHGGVRAFLRSWFAEFSRVEYELVHAEAAGDRVLTAATQRGHGSGSGAPVEMTFWMVWTFRDDLIVRAAMYPAEEPARADFQQP